MMSPATVIGPLFGVVVGLIVGVPLLIGRHAPDNPAKPGSMAPLPAPPATPAIATPLAAPSEAPASAPQPPQSGDNDGLFAEFQRRIDQKNPPRIAVSTGVGSTTPKVSAKGPPGHYRHWVRRDDAPSSAASKATQLNRTWLGGLLHAGE
jgi:hypothetical protein